MPFENHHSKIFTMQMTRIQKISASWSQIAKKNEKVCVFSGTSRPVAVYFAFGGTFGCLKKPEADRVLLDVCSAHFRIAEESGRPRMCFTKIRRQLLECINRKLASDHLKTITQKSSPCK
jgi:hypothetical protein